MTFKDKVYLYSEKLFAASEQYEKEHPNRQLECLYWILERCLLSLRAALDAPDSKGISWSAPFMELHFPVDCDWFELNGDAQFRINAGAFTKDNLKGEETAIKTLTKIMVSQLELSSLQEVTQFSALAQEGDNLTPILDPEVIDRLQAIQSQEERDGALRSLLQPCSFGAGTIEYPGDMKEGDTIPEYVAIQLSKIKPPLISVSLAPDDEGSAAFVIFEVHPLVVNFTTKTAYYPINIGLSLFLAPSTSKVKSPPWEQFEKWPPVRREKLWNSLFDAVSEQIKLVGLIKPTEIKDAIVSVNAKIQVPAEGGIDLKELSKVALQTLQKLGIILQFELRSQGGLGASAETAALSALEKVESAQTNEEKGESLETLMTVLFGTIEGFRITNRARTVTEEIDLFIVNEGDVPAFKREGDVILVECKYWSKPCGKNEFVAFQQKMANRSERCSLGYFVSWNGFADTFASEMLRASRQRELIVPLNGQQIKAAIEAGTFLECIVSARDKAILT